MFLLCIIEGYRIHTKIPGRLFADPFSYLSIRPRRETIDFVERGRCGEQVRLRLPARKNVPAERTLM